jgi:hypothetical protein
VQIRVHPRAVLAHDVLRDPMRGIPVAMPFVPQRFERGRETGGGSRLLQRSFKHQHVHGFPAVFDPSSDPTMTDGI